MATSTGRSKNKPSNVISIEIAKNNRRNVRQPAVEDTERIMLPHEYPKRTYQGITATYAYKLWKDAVEEYNREFIPEGTPRDKKIALNFYLSAKPCFEWYGVDLTHDVYFDFVMFLCWCWGEDGVGIANKLKLHGEDSGMFYRSGNYPGLNRLSKSGNASVLAKGYIKELRKAQAEDKTTVSSV